jgi:hypothetical protein
VCSVEKVIESFGKHGVEPLREEERGDLARCLEDLVSGGKVFPSSLCSLTDGLLGMMDTAGRPMLFGVSGAHRIPSWFTRFTGEFSDVRGLRLLIAGLSSDNAAILRETVPHTRPQVLGVNPAFGFGDRLGLATPGHAMAASRAEGKILPVFAQQSIREMSRTERTPQEVLNDATWGVFRAGWTAPFGADADHLKTKFDVEVTAEAGFTFYTVDPSDYVDQRAHDYDVSQIEEKFQALIDDKVEGASDFIKLYRGKTFEFNNAEESVRVTFDELLLKRAAVKYGRALAHMYEMAGHVEKSMGPRPFELEISVDETPQPTSPLEHLFIALELKRHGTSIISLAPRFVGDFEKGVDYKGDISVFEDSLRQHMAIAEQFGPCKISVHSGSDKLRIYPSFGRICRNRFHVKTAGTSYLEALRVICRVDKELFRSIVEFARLRFEPDRASYHISTELDLVRGPEDLGDGELEEVYLNRDEGRQILHVTFGSVLTAKNDHGYRFRERIKTILHQHVQLHEEVLRHHLGKHVQLLLEN